MNAFGAAGLIYDIVGVVMLASSLVATKTETLFQQALAFWGGNKPLFKALMVQRFDALWGLPLLVAGFAMQMETALYPDAKGEFRTVAYLLLGLLLYLVIFLAWRRRYERALDTRFAERVKKEEGGAG